MFRNLPLLAAGLVLLSAAPLCAADAVLGQMYGNGVHAYFSRDYVRAYEHLTSAIDGGSADPRCYYFRGLTYTRLGREQESEMDFAKGAELESRDIDRFYNVARSLGRIQGKTRLLLEQHRAKARLAALKRAEEARKARYEAIRAEEERVLHEPIEPVPGPTGVGPGGPGGQAAPEPEPYDHFETELQPPAEDGDGPSASPFEPVTPEETAIEPAPATDGQRESSRVFGALRGAVDKTTGFRAMLRAVGNAMGIGGEEPIGVIEGHEPTELFPADGNLEKLLPGVGQEPGLPDEEGADPFEEKGPGIGMPGTPPAPPLPKPPGEPTDDPVADDASIAPPVPTPPEPAKEPLPEPSTEPMDDPFAEDEPAAEPTPEPLAEPTPEPAAEPIPEPPDGDPFGG